METQDNGFLLVIDGVRKEKERLQKSRNTWASFIFKQIPPRDRNSLETREIQNEKEEFEKKSSGKISFKSCWLKLS